MSIADTVLAMAHAGCSIEQAASAVAYLKAEQAAKADARWRARLALIAPLLFDAVELALFGSQVAKADSAAASPLSESAFPSTAPRSAPIKTAARAGLLTGPLKPAAQAVAAWLVEHHSIKTGRCDPSVARLAEETGFCARSVRRSLGELERAGMIARMIQVGRRHTNSYDLNLERMAGLGERLQAKADSGEKRTLEADSRVTQNREKKYISAEPPRARQLELPVMAVVRRGDLTDEQHASARLQRDMHREFQGEALRQLYERLQVDDLMDRALKAEMRQPGSGIFAIVTTLLRETGPPAAAQGG